MMDLKTVEKILEVSYDSDKAFNFRGKLQNALFSFGLSRVNRQIKRGVPLLSSIENYSNKIGLRCTPKYNSKYKQLLRDYKNEHPSFIFYGDHQFVLEPLIYFLGFIDSRKLTSDQNQNIYQGSPIKLIASDTLLLQIPESLEIIMPVVLRDSDGQYKICKTEFVENRRKNRRALSTRSIEESARYLLEGDKNLVIYPQGFIGNTETWKSGIIRIADKVLEYSGGAADNVYFVPVSCPDLGKDDLWKVSLRILFGIIGLSRERVFQINYGRPVPVKEFLGSSIGNDKSLEERRKIMRSQVLALREKYYQWTGEHIPRNLKEKFPMKDLRRIIQSIPSLSWI